MYIVTRRATSRRLAVDGATYRQLLRARAAKANDVGQHKRATPIAHARFLVILLLLHNRHTMPKTAVHIPPNQKPPPTLTNTKTFQKNLQLLDSFNTASIRPKPQHFPVLTSSFLHKENCISLDSSATLDQNSS